MEAPWGDEILLLIFQNLCQHFVTLLKASNGIHNLMVCCVISGFVQLVSQLCQFLGMGGIMADHILHQCHQFFHRGMGVVMCVTVLMQMIVVMGVLVRMGMFVLVLVGVSMTVMGMLVGMGMGMLVVMVATGDMIVINVILKSMTA